MTRPLSNDLRERVVSAVVGGYFLAIEHRAHLLGALPYVLLLVCPLMHMFMHRGHGHGGPGRTRRSDDEHRRD